MDRQPSPSGGVLTISGRTTIYGIVADPIEHVKTPEAINEVIRRRGVDGILVPFQVREADFESWIQAARGLRNLGGFIVTVPHKTRMIHLCDEVTERARRIGAVNTVRREPDGRLIADMLDGVGFVGGLHRGGIGLPGTRVYLAGAGGAANAIAFALADSGIARLTIANRTRSKAEALVRRLAQSYPDLALAAGDDPSGHDLVINATSLGLRDSDPMPLNAARLPPQAIVAEIIMQPEETPLLVAARQRGCRIHPGLPMLLSQVELMADFMGIGP